MPANLTIERLVAFHELVKRNMPGCVSCIAGGAVRDTLQGVEVKDIDVFVQADGLEWAEGCDQLADAMHGSLKYTELTNSAAYEGGATFELAEIPEGLHMHPIQLIRVKADPIENIEANFDFGLSMAYIAHGRLNTTRSYWRDHFNKTITYRAKNPTDQQRESSRARLQRLKLKYPKWRFTNCGSIS